MKYPKKISEKLQVNFNVKLIQILLALTCLAFSISCTTKIKPENSHQSFSQTVEVTDGSILAYDRGIIELPMNRNSQSNQLIGIEYYRFKKDDNAPEGIPPVFILKGGPGFDDFAPLINRKGYYENNIKPYDQFTDVVVVGQRGFGTSFDTSCENSRQLTSQEIFDFDAQNEALTQALKECRSKWEKAGVDLQGFNVIQAAADINDIAHALNYQKIQLVGVSFGSHWGMTVMRDFPDRVARATFSALEGPDHTYDHPGYILNAYKRMAASAEASDELKAVIPENGLIDAYHDLIKKADKEAIQVDFKVPDSDQVIPVNITGDHLRSLIGGYTRGLSFRHRTVDWPLDIITMLNGDFQGALTRLYNLGSDTEIRAAAFYMYDCGSGLSQQRGNELRNHTAADLIGKNWLFYDQPCEVWESDLGEGFRQGFETDIPTLLIHGSWDVSTPIENAEEVRSIFNQHKYIPIDQGTHGAMLDAIVEIKGFEDNLLKWIRTGNYDHLSELSELPPMQWKEPK